MTRVNAQMFSDGSLRRAQRRGPVVLSGGGGWKGACFSSDAVLSFEWCLCLHCVKWERCSMQAQQLWSSASCVWRSRDVKWAGVQGQGN